MERLNDLDRDAANRDAEHEFRRFHADWLRRGGSPEELEAARERCDERRRLADEAAGSPWPAR